MGPKKNTTVGASSSGTASKTTAGASSSGSKRPRPSDDEDIFAEEPPQTNEPKNKKKKEKKIRPNHGRDLFAKRSPEVLVEKMKTFNEEQVRAVNEMGFGGITLIQINKIPSRLAIWILDNFEPVSCSIVLDSKRRLHIAEEDVYLTLGFPRGKTMMQRRKKQEYASIITSLAKRLKKKKNMLLPSVNEEEMMSDVHGGDTFKRCFLILVELYLIETSADGYVKPKILDYIMDVKEISNLNWCAYLLSILVYTHNAWSSSKKTVFTGPMVFLMACYVDRVVHCYRPIERSFPTIREWTGGLLRKREEEELELEKFGRGHVEKRLDISGLPVEEIIRNNKWITS